MGIMKIPSSEPITTNRFGETEIIFCLMSSRLGEIDECDKIDLQAVFGETQPDSWTIYPPCNY